jgi:hypothetical protein
MPRPLITITCMDGYPILSGGVASGLGDSSFLMIFTGISETFAGIGAPRSNTFINTGVQRAPERIFNRDRSFGPRSGTNTLRSQSGATGVVRQPSMSTRTAANPFAASRVYSSPPGGGRTFTPRAGAPSGGRTFTAPVGRSGGSGGRQSSQPAGRGRTNRPTR